MSLVRLTCELSFSDIYTSLHQLSIKNRNTKRGSRRRGFEPILRDRGFKTRPRIIAEYQRVVQILRFLLVHLLLPSD